MPGWITNPPIVELGNQNQAQCLTLARQFKSFVEGWGRDAPTVKSKNGLKICDDIIQKVTSGMQNTDVFAVYMYGGNPLALMIFSPTNNYVSYLVSHPSVAGGGATMIEFALNHPNCAGAFLELTSATADATAAYRVMGFEHGYGPDFQGAGPMKLVAKHNQAKWMRLNDRWLYVSDGTPGTSYAEPINPQAQAWSPRPANQ